jgi:hypothetical protein
VKEDLGLGSGSGDRFLQVYNQFGDTTKLVVNEFQPSVLYLLAAPATPDALPETFVDHAEEIWRMLGDDKTQQQVADEMEWGLSKTKQYSRLDQISPTVWERIVTDISKVVTNQSNDGVTEKVTLVTENLLRNILDLTECHQQQIIQSGRRNLTPAWKIELELGNKEDLLKKGREKREQNLKQNAPEVSQNDISEQPQHSTRTTIAKSAGVSTGQVGMAEQVRKKAPELID